MSENKQLLLKVPNRKCQETSTCKNLERWFKNEYKNKRKGVGGGSKPIAIIPIEHRQCVRPICEPEGRARFYRYG